MGLVTDMELSNPTTATLFAKAIDTSSVSSGTGSCAGKDVTSQLLNSPASQFKVLIGEEMTRDISGEWKGLAGKRSVVVGIDELKKYSPNGEQLMGKVIVSRRKGYRYNGEGGTESRSADRNDGEGYHGDGEEQREGLLAGDPLGEDRECPACQPGPCGGRGTAGV